MPEPENQEGDSQATSPPEGIKPIFLSGPSQQIFGCVTDTDVTDENPFKFISKAAIAEDFKTRAAISDFHPVKKQVQVICHDMITVSTYRHLQPYSKL